MILHLLRRFTALSCLVLTALLCSSQSHSAGACYQLFQDASAKAYEVLEFAGATPNLVSLTQTGLFDQPRLFIVRGRTAVGKSRAMRVGLVPALKHDGVSTLHLPAVRIVERIWNTLDVLNVTVLVVDNVIDTAPSVPRLSQTTFPLLRPIIEERYKKGLSTIFIESTAGASSGDDFSLREVTFAQLEDVLATK